MMTPQDYIQNKLDKLAEPVVLQRVDSDQIKPSVRAKLLAKRFRKYKADDELLTIADKAIDLAVENDEPLIIGILFGGNKLWRFDEAPEIDWAELFSLMYYIDWAKTIASVYNPGVIIDYYSQDISVETLNNVPHEQTDRYSETFRQMLEFMKPYIPSGITVQYRRHADDVKDRDTYLAEIEDAKRLILKENGGKLPEMSEVEKLATELNVNLKPGQDDDPQWHQKVELEHQAIFLTPSLIPYLTNPKIVPTCPTPYPGCLATGSTRRSLAKFWAGVGALEPKGDKYVDLVLTPKQLEKAVFEWKDISLPGLVGKNFKRIRIIK